MMTKKGIFEMLAFFYPGESGQKKNVSISLSDPESSILKMLTKIKRGKNDG